MIEPRLFLCSGANLAANDLRRQGRCVVELDSLGAEPNVHIRLHDVAKVLAKNLPARLVDLLEIASYVYTADAATRRGTEWTDDNTTESWDRDFHFIIPVRDPSFWQSADVVQRLLRILKFLSNDKYNLEFCELPRDRSLQEYLEFRSEENWPFNGVHRVLMFSGGLDSLAGAVETAKAGENLVLVSHRPVSTLDSRQRQLFREFRSRYSNPMIHIPVWINKDQRLGREHTQRTRSFLYAALGTVIAESINAAGVRFFENGIVSLNLPVADEVQRARASRTTHPITLDQFAEFFGLVVGHKLDFDNPYIFKTKPEIVSLIVNNGAGDLIQHSCSCAHTGRFHSASQWHCGTCSQCIDRRIAILAAGAESLERVTDYKSDVFTGPREDGYEKNMAVNYVRHATELFRMSEKEIAASFNRDISRAVRSFTERGAAAEQFIGMHKRHGETVYHVIEQQLEQNAGRLLTGGLEESSMLALVAGGQHLTSSWRQYSDRIASLLSGGLPRACKSHKPKDEPHLQELCDGILQGNDPELVREFPFMRWSSSSTKPDWSSESLSLWVELKYVRKKGDIRQITEDIAADITKYGDNGRRVLFVVYDPAHLIVDRHGFSEPILRRQEMLVHFVP